MRNKDIFFIFPQTSFDCVLVPVLSRRVSNIHCYVLFRTQTKKLIMGATFVPVHVQCQHKISYKFDKTEFRRNNSDSSITWKQFFPTLYLFYPLFTFDLFMFFNGYFFSDEDFFLQPSSHLVTNCSTRYKLGQAFLSLASLEKFFFAYNCYFHPVIPFRKFLFMIHQVCKATFKFFEKTHV